MATRRESLSLVPSSLQPRKPPQATSASSSLSHPPEQQRAPDSTARVETQQRNSPGCQTNRRGSIITIPSLLSSIDPTPPHYPHMSP
ncbi:unnamed protein product [Zymoseptoria tritici ST99CH_3D7]|uniref:Uncharacterized protein n=1 Tax=Zymoseptoria tritici (strain ST99CH_3D7) TaxID=1276538 RepID=A0A1X7S6A3_ZYMT9|nr:unnamed protein product [Zymoseptoria tritici ST99CH_3D7]